MIIKKKGVVYFAEGSRFWNECLKSANTFKRYHPDIPITVFTTINNLKKSRNIDSLVVVPALDNPFKTKIAAIAQSPYDLNLYLDTDTIIKSSLYELFDFLINYDFGIANRVHCTWGKQTIFIDYVDKYCYNTGVFLFRRNEIVSQMFEEWKRRVMDQDASIMRSGRFGDQHHFNEMIFKDKMLQNIQMKIVEIPNKIYNARSHMLNQLRIDGDFHKAKILHYHFPTTLTDHIKILKTKFRQKFNFKLNIKKEIG